MSFSSIKTRQQIRHLNILTAVIPVSTRHQTRHLVLSGHQWSRWWYSTIVYDVQSLIKPSSHWLSWPLPSSPITNPTLNFKWNSLEFKKIYLGNVVRVDVHPWRLMYQSQSLTWYVASTLTYRWWSSRETTTSMLDFVPYPQCKPRFLKCFYPV